MAKIRTQLEKYTTIVTELKNWTEEKRSSKILLEVLGPVETQASRDAQLDFYSMMLEAVKSDPTSNYHYLDGIIQNKEVKLKQGNVLILSPLGSGKTKAIRDFGMYNENTLTLVHYEKEKYNGDVMLYDEFVSKFNNNKDFLNSFDYIICEEFQLFINKKNEGHQNRISAIEYLLSKHDGKNLIYFSSSESELFKKYMEEYNYMKVFDFNPMSVKIKRYFPEAEYNMKTLLDLYMYFEASIIGFNYYGCSIVALSKTRYEQNKIFEMAKNTGFKPINLELKSSIKEKRIFLETGKIPEGYNCIIIDNLDDNYNLENEEFKLAIINSDSELDKMRMFERLHENVEVVCDKTEEEY